MSALQWQLAIGATLGLGIALVVRGLIPAPPDLGAALRTLTPPVARTGPGPADLPTRVGLWASDHAPQALRPRVSAADYALLGINPISHAGRRLLAAGYGLAFPTLLNLMLTLAGAPLPWVLPAAAGLPLAAVFALAADGTVHNRAAEARLDFTRALVAYLDVVTLERRSGAGTTAALETAAAAADNPTFHRIRGTLATAHWAGQPPWDALETLAADIEVPALADLAHTMRLAGEESTSVADTLAARSRALRTALAEDEHAHANAAGERMWVAGALLAVIYMAMLAVPAVLRVLSTS